MYIYIYIIVIIILLIMIMIMITIIIITIIIIMYYYHYYYYLLLYNIILYIYSTCIYCIYAYIFIIIYYMILYVCISLRQANASLNQGSPINWANKWVHMGPSHINSSISSYFHAVWDEEARAKRANEGQCPNRKWWFHGLPSGNLLQFAIENGP